MTDKEKLEELEAARKLQNMAYIKKTCKSPDCIKNKILGIPCFLCGGKGYYWASPLTK